jgi:gliding motility-associated lipoprotein GldH
MDKTIDRKRLIKTINSLIVLILLFFVCACSRNSYYEHYQSISDTGWNKDSVARFQIDISNISEPFDILINVRHTNKYPYQNFWLFISETSPSGKTTQDTIECYLADNRGKWLGSGLSSIYTMPVLIQQSRRFSQAGKYSFAIRHGMRDDVLAGISDIGIEIDHVR